MGKKIKNPNSYIKKKIKKILELNLSKKKKPSFTILITNKQRWRYSTWE